MRYMNENKYLIKGSGEKIMSVFPLNAKPFGYSRNGLKGNQKHIWGSQPELEADPHDKQRGGEWLRAESLRASWDGCWGD